MHSSLYLTKNNGYVHLSLYVVHELIKSVQLLPNCEILFKACVYNQREEKEISEYYCKSLDAFFSYLHNLFSAADNDTRRATENQNITVVDQSTKNNELKCSGVELILRNECNC